MADRKTKGRKPSKSLLSVSNLMDSLGVMPHRGRSVIGVQLTSDMLRVIEIDKSTDPPRIGNFSSIDPLMENVNEAADQIVGLLIEKGMKARLVHATVYEPGTELRQVNIPVMGRNEMEALVQREVKKIVPESSPREVSFDFWHSRSARKGRKSDVLVGVVPRESVARIIDLMEHAELDTELVSTVPMSLIAGLSAMGGKYLEKISAMVHLERDRSYLVIANRGNWVFSREFPTVLAKQEDEGDKQQLGVKRKFRSARYNADQDRLLIEVNRSLLYFKQRFRGEGVSLATLSGEAFNLDDIVGAFKNNLGIEAEVFSPLGAFDTKALGDRANKLDRILPSLALPLGAALQDVREAKLNFVPPAYRNRHRARVRRLVVGAVSVAAVIGLLVSYLMVRDTRTDLEEMVEQNRQEEVIQQLSKKLDEVAEVVRHRERADLQEKFLRRFDGETGGLEMLLVGLSHLVPENMLLITMNVDRNTGNSVEVVGQVESPGLAESDMTFSRFINDLERSGLFSEVNEPEMAVSSNDGRYLLEFRMTCSLNI